MSAEKYLPETARGCLAHLIEECGEVLAAAGKIYRFGWQSVNPELPKNMQEQNVAWLLREMDDLEQAIIRLRNAINIRPHVLGEKL